MEQLPESLIAYVPTLVNQLEKAVISGSWDGIKGCQVDVWVAHIGTEKLGAFQAYSEHTDPVEQAERRALILMDLSWRCLMSRQPEVFMDSLQSQFFFVNNIMSVQLFTNDCLDIPSVVGYLEYVIDKSNILNCFSTEDVAYLLSIMCTIITDRIDPVRDAGNTTEQARQRVQSVCHAAQAAANVMSRRPDASEAMIKSGMAEYLDARWSKVCRHINRNSPSHIKPFAHAAFIQCVMLKQPQLKAILHSTGVIFDPGHFAPVWPKDTAQERMLVLRKLGMKKENAKMYACVHCYTFVSLASYKRCRELGSKFKFCSGQANFERVC